MEKKLKEILGQKTDKIHLISPAKFGNIPVVSVSGTSLAEAWENAMIGLYVYGCEIRTQYDAKDKKGNFIDPPSKDCSILISIENPVSEPMIHMGGIPGGFEDLEEYVQEVRDGIKDHWIRNPLDPESKVHAGNITDVCNECHPGHKESMHIDPGMDSSAVTCASCHTGHQTDMASINQQIFKEGGIYNQCNICHSDSRHQKENLAHGEIMIMETNGDKANCTKCHIYHWKMPGKHLEARRSTRASCVNCHAEQEREYKESIHYMALATGHEGAPDCVTCHGDTDIEKTSERFTPEGVIELCASCHSDREKMLSFGINLPIWPHKVRAGVDEARLREMQARAAYARQEDSVLFEVQDAYINLESLREQWRLYQDTLIPQAEQSRDSSEAAYKTGKLTFLELLDSERFLLNVRYGYAKVKSEYLTALAGMERALGVRFPG